MNMLEAHASSINTHPPESRPLASKHRALGATPGQRQWADVRAPGIIVGRCDVASGADWRERETLLSVTALIDAVNCALAGHYEQAQHNARIAVQALDEEIAARARLVPATADSVATRPGCGGLAPWQMRRVATYIDANLADSIRCDDMARVTRLSVSHFMRAFRESFGAPAHAFLMRRRMERAQGLMLTTDTTLGQIALECGLADQSHLTRLFRKLVGESPAAWRRARMYRSP
jgi:AraC-like DNA-binding protein